MVCHKTKNVTEKKHDGDKESGNDDDDIAMKTMEIQSCVRMDDWSSYLDQNVDKLRRLS